MHKHKRKHFNDDANWEDETRGMLQTRELIWTAAIIAKKKKDALFTAMFTLTGTGYFLHLLY